MLRSMEQTRHSWHLGKKIKHTQGLAASNQGPLRYLMDNLYTVLQAMKVNKLLVRSNEELKLRSQMLSIRPGQVTTV